MKQTLAPLRVAMLASALLLIFVARNTDASPCDEFVDDVDGPYWYGDVCFLHLHHMLPPKDLMLIRTSLITDSGGTHAFSDSAAAVLPAPAGRYVLSYAQTSATPPRSEPAAAGTR